MRTNYIKQAYAHLRQDPVTAVVIIIGTALPLFLIILVIILQQINIVPYAPESNRDRMMFGRQIDFSIKNDPNTYTRQPMNEMAANRLYKSLKTPEVVSMYGLISSSVISATGIKPYNVDVKPTDDEYWKIFDFKFISGKPYDKLTLNSRKAGVVICESVAKKLFGNTNVADKEMSIDHKTFKIAGVVKDVSTLTPRAYSCIWIPYKETAFHRWDNWVIGGMYNVVILARSRKDFNKIKKEFREKVDLINNDSTLRKQQIHVYTNGRPYSILEENIDLSEYSETTPNIDNYWRKQLMIFLILLFVPAINLTSILHSRIQRCIPEIGIRRAVGCTRTAILYDIIIENFILSLLGAIIAIVFSVLFILFGIKLLFINNYQTLTDPTITLPMLLHCSIFMSAFVFCFILNLLCSLVPAWHVSRYNIIDAINKSTH